LFYNINWISSSWCVCDLIVQLFFIESVDLYFRFVCSN
jgi:hypothetical protein